MTVTRKDIEKLLDQVVELITPGENGVNNFQHLLGRIAWYDRAEVVRTRIERVQSAIKLAETGSTIPTCPSTSRYLRYRFAAIDLLGEVRVFADNGTLEDVLVSIEKLTAVGYTKFSQAELYEV